MFPFIAASPDELKRDLDKFVDATISSLSSYYLEIPKGDHWVDPQRFHAAFAVLQSCTGNFASLDRPAIVKAIEAEPLVFVVLRCVVGLSPPELADLACERLEAEISQNFAREQDQRAKDGLRIINSSALSRQRIEALVEAACIAIEEGCRQERDLTVHRLDKVDTRGGLESVRTCAEEGVPYPELLLERMLGRPFASHRDSVSEKVGDFIEDAIAEQLTEAGVPFYQTKRAERLKGFDQAPDFLIPDATTPKVVIEAKLTQDDGTARDKVTRVQHLDRLSEYGAKFEVIACIDGRGFTIRREDMRKLILATRGKVFSIATIGHLVSKTSLREFAKGQ